MIKIICVGKLTQKYLKEGILYYQKQIPYKIEFIEVKDEADIKGLEKEKNAILKQISSNDYVISLAIEGNQHSSEEFAKKLEGWLIAKTNDLVFIIGGSYGLHQDIKERSQSLISFSKLTFPHQLMRLILIEQIYRATTINKNHPYHK